MQIKLQGVFNIKEQARIDLENAQKKLNVWRDRIDEFILIEPTGKAIKLWCNNLRTILVTGDGIHCQSHTYYDNGDFSTEVVREDLLRACDDWPDFLKYTLNDEAIDDIKACIRIENKAVRNFRQVRESLLFIRRVYELTPDQTDDYEEKAKAAIEMP